MQELDEEDGVSRSSAAAAEPEQCVGDLQSLDLVNPVSVDPGSVGGTD